MQQTFLNAGQNFSFDWLHSYIPYEIVWTLHWLVQGNRGTKDQIQKICIQQSFSLQWLKKES